MQTLYAEGKIRQIGIIFLNGDNCPIYAHEASGDIFVHILAEDQSTLISELTLTDDMLDVPDDEQAYTDAIFNAGEGAIGAIRHVDGTFTVIIDRDNARVAVHGTETTEVDMSIDVSPEDYYD